MLKQNNARVGFYILFFCFCFVPSDDDNGLDRHHLPSLSIYIYLLSEIGNERMYKLSMPYAAETIKSVIYFKLT